MDEEKVQEEVSRLAQYFDIDEKVVKDVYEWMQRKENGLILSAEALSERAYHKIGGQIPLDQEDKQELLLAVAESLR